MSNYEFSRQNFIKMVIETYDLLEPSQRSSYNLGKKLAQLKGTKLKPMVQEANALISSYISDLLVELLFPLLTEENEIYRETRKRCYSNFISGIVSVR